MNRECLGEGGVEKKGHTQTKKPLEVCQVVCVCVCGVAVGWGMGGGMIKTLFLLYFLSGLPEATINNWPRLNIQSNSASLVYINPIRSDFN